jgi:hypothetical protein
MAILVSTHRRRFLKRCSAAMLSLGLAGRVLGQQRSGADQQIPAESGRGRLIHFFGHPTFEFVFLISLGARITWGAT